MRQAVMDSTAATACFDKTVVSSCENNQEGNVVNIESEIEDINQSLAPDHQIPKQAWSDAKKTNWMSSFTNLSAMRIYVVACVILSIACIGVCASVYASSGAGRRLENILFGSYDEAMLETEKLGLLGKILDDARIMIRKVETLSSWANNSACIPGSGLIFRNSCYRLTGTEMTFLGAEHYCTARGGFVAFTQNEEEWNAFLDYLWSLGYDHRGEFWIGLRKDVSENIWRYSNGDIAEFVRWSKGNIFDEGFDCAQMRTEPSDRAGVYDRRCSDVAQALCQFRTQ